MVCIPPKTKSRVTDEDKQKEDAAEEFFSASKLMKIKTWVSWAMGLRKKANKKAAVKIKGILFHPFSFRLTDGQSANIIVPLILRSFDGIFAN